jgi:predicted TIM-barrel fold metal-dependent hydrolase
MNLFDCNCWYGRPPRPPFRFAVTPAELLEQMDFCGIGMALAYHVNQRFGAPQVYDRVAQEDLRGRSRLFPVRTLLPPQTGELPPPDVFLAELRRDGVRALRAFPSEHRYRLDGLTFGPHLEMLAAERIPLLVKADCLAIADLLHDCPELTVIAMSQGPHSLERYLRPILDRYANLHLDTSGLLVEGLIEEFVARYGGERLVFGSGFPDNAAGGAQNYLRFANIPEEARAAIASGNLCRLLNLPPSRACCPDRDSSTSLGMTAVGSSSLPRECHAELVEASRRRRVCDLGKTPPAINHQPSTINHSLPLIIDMHGHWAEFPGGHLPVADEAKMLAAMDRCGVRTIVCSSHEALLGDFERGNCVMQAAIGRHPGRLLGYWAVNPHYEASWRQAPEDVARAKGFVGFKFLPDYHAYPVDAPHYAPALAQADRQGLCVMIHTWGGSAYNSPQHVERLAKQYPNARLIMGHSGFGDWEFSAALARDFPNVYLDLTAVYAAHDFSVLPAGSGTPAALGSALHVNGVIEYFVAVAGSGKVLLGTDLPWYSPHYAAGAVIYAHITDADRHNILHRNAERLLKG